MNRRRLSAVTLALAIALTASSMAHAAAELGDPAPFLTTSGSSCTSIFSCTFFQSTDVGANSYVAPRSGVVTRYTVHKGNDFTGINAVGLRVFRPQSGGAWLLAAASTSDTELTAPGNVRQEIPTRVPIQAGDHVGLSVEFDGNTAWRHPTGAATDVVQMVTGLAPTLGTTIMPANLTPFTFNRVNVRAHLETDGDGDGYGDESQDGCPFDPAHQAAQCTPPAAAGLAFSRSRFRVDRSGAILKDAALRRGAAIRFTLSQLASVQFVVSRVRSGRRTGRGCVPATRRNRAKRRCSLLVTRHHWRRSDLAAGAIELPYSGRYLQRGRTESLSPGRYRLTAVPSNTGGVGPAARANFTIVAR